MKAVVWHGPGDIRMEERPLPEVGPGEMLLRPQVMGICGSDMKLYKYGMLGTYRPSQPFIIGHETAGVIAALGPGVEGFSVGDPVGIDPLLACGECFYCLRGEQNLCERMLFKGVTTDGVFSEFVLVHPHQAVRLPPGFDLRLGATIEPLSISLQALRCLPVSPSDSVLLIGSGTIGLGVIGILACRGVRKVLAVDIQDYACRRAIEMGAANAVNSAREDLAGASAAFFGPRGPDVVIEAAGSPEAQAAAFELARPGGSLLMIGITPELTIAVNISRLVRSNLRVFGTIRTSGDAYRAAADLVISGRVPTAGWISRVFPFEQASGAFEYAVDPAHQVTKCLMELPS